MYSATNMSIPKSGIILLLAFYRLLGEFSGLGSFTDTHSIVKNVGLEI